MEKRLDSQSIKITACVIARNEELTIERALKSLHFADEIIVVDAQSTDRTVDIARQYADFIVVNPWEGFAKQRNAALKASHGEWVFFLDSDEQASEALGKKLVEIARQPSEGHPNCYSIRRVEYFLGKELNYGPGNPSHQWRFFKRADVVFHGDVHEYPEFVGSIGMIDEPIYHWPDLSIEKFLTKLNHYTTLEALDKFQQGQRTTLAHACLTFFSTFLKNGIRYRGFWNGKEGFVLTLLEAISRVVRHLKLWTLWQVHEGKIALKLSTPLPKPGTRTAPEKTELERPVWSSESQL